MTIVLNPPKTASVTPVDPSHYALVKDEFGRCLIKPTFFEDFYKEFIGKSSEIGRMFANTEMSSQKEALRAGLTFLIMYAEGKSPFATEKLDKLGASHKRTRLNVRPDMYPLWIQSLIATVRKHVPTFNETSLKAWQTVLQNGVNRIVSHYND
ncbi:MAG: globin [Planctomycetaceae bacterium]|nr:globin [Planctomycetaceae bacterium]